MRKRELIIIGILIASLWFNVATLNQVQNLSNQLNNLRSEFVSQLDIRIGPINNLVNKMVAEQEWIQQTNFTLNKEASREDRMVVRGEWTFNEIKNGQQPILFYREQGTTTWAKEVLESLGGLNYGVEITLSPEKKYEYQITAEGDVSNGSTILPIPQNVYGLPEKKIDLSLTPITNSSSQNVEVYIGFAPAPLDEMNPSKVSIQVENKGQVLKSIPLAIKSNLNNEFSGSWEISSEDKLAMSPDTEFFIITEFKNGVVLKEKTNVIINGKNQASKRIIYEEKK